LVEGEEEQLLQSRTVLRNQERLAEGVGAAYGALYDGEENPSALELCQIAASTLAPLERYLPQLGALAQKLEEVSDVLSDCAEELRDIRDSMESGEYDLDSLETRLDLIYRLKKKYGGSVEEILYDEPAEE